ncbi:uncharacterized protein ARB_00572 [Trichophyton benhamiae CBS 112371]|uniref:Uncharacterized protein n=1 Tax=Arthroderma benhamiae (strain ATCC MYA-4681 / CBS 112371) TaxID=663331 RepID=D4AWK6_ARTBC|nr:uncharacterized protein ARB_00572 [Trichophyton benhamiae CBS 112371]EFE32387.1 hypothetical protein ARB_00572 [Trichophyton benhamiae CBS 112371]
MGRERDIKHLQHQTNHQSSQLVDSTAILPAQWPTYLPSHPAQGWKCKSSLLLLQLRLLLLLLLPPVFLFPLATTTRPNVRVLSIHPPIHACTIHAHIQIIKSKEDSRKKQRWGSTYLLVSAYARKVGKTFFSFFSPPSLISGGNDSFFLFSFRFALFASLFFAFEISLLVETADKAERPYSAGTIVIKSQWMVVGELTTKSARLLKSLAKSRSYDCSMTYYYYCLLLLLILFTVTARADLSARPGLPHTSTVHPVQYQIYIHTDSITACKEEVSNPPANPYQRDNYI